MKTFSCGDSENKQIPFLIGIAGGTASGKTSIAKIIKESLEKDGISCEIVSQDNFYKKLSGKELELAFQNEYNFDHPDSQDFEMCLKVLRNVKSETVTEVTIPIYDHSLHQRTGTKTIPKSKVCIFEGIMLFAEEQVRDSFDQKIFVDVDADTRLARRILRDMEERGRSIGDILEQYQKFVKPSFDDLIYPTKRYADVIIPRGKENTTAIEIMLHNIKNKMATPQ